MPSRTVKQPSLDKPNPTTAARLVQPLGQWRRYDAARQGLMRAALDRILGAPVFVSLFTCVNDASCSLDISHVRHALNRPLLE